MKALCSRYKSGDYSEKEIINSGLIYSGSKVIVFNENYSTKSTFSDEINNDFQLDPSHLRIIWVIISLMIIIYYVNRIRNRDEVLDG